MTPVPEPGGQPGEHEERQAQWFLELSFFRDGLLRNPPRKGGKGELADAVVLHGDVALMVQVKAQISARPPHVWAVGAIRDALKQLGFTNRMLADGHIRALTSATLGELPFDSAKHPNRWGLIVLDQPPDPFDPSALVPEITIATFPVQVYSLADFRVITERFDTAGDLINYMEMRAAFRSSLDAHVHEEGRTLERVLAQVGDYFRHFKSGLSDEIMNRTIDAVKRTGSGEFVGNVYGRIYDDIIARLHDVDPALEENAGKAGPDIFPILVELGWLTRARRVALGRSLASMCASARDGTDRILCHFQRPRGIVFVYLVSSLPRKERAATLSALALRAQAKYDSEAALGIATEPIGGGGRSYDAAYRRGRLNPCFVAELRKTEDPFGNDSQQLTP